MRPKTLDNVDLKKKKLNRPFREIYARGYGLTLNECIAKIAQL